MHPPTVTRLMRRVPNIANCTWTTTNLQFELYHTWSHFQSATNGIAIIFSVPTMTSGARACEQHVVRNATSAAQLQNIYINAILAGVPLTIIGRARAAGDLHQVGARVFLAGAWHAMGSMGWEHGPSAGA